jgi:hypothetical protein
MNLICLLATFLATITFPIGSEIWFAGSIKLNFVSRIAIYFLIRGLRIALRDCQEHHLVSPVYYRSGLTLFLSFFKYFYLNLMHFPYQLFVVSYFMVWVLLLKVQFKVMGVSFIVKTFMFQTTVTPKLDPCL